MGVKASVLFVDVLFGDQHLRISTLLDLVLEAGDELVVFDRHLFAVVGDLHLELIHSVAVAYYFLLFPSLHLFLRVLLRGLDPKIFGKSMAFVVTVIYRLLEKGSQLYLSLQELYLLLFLPRFMHRS